MTNEPTTTQLPTSTGELTIIQLPTTTSGTTTAEVLPITTNETSTIKLPTTTNEHTTTELPTTTAESSVYESPSTTTIQLPEAPQPITARFTNSLDRILITLSDSIRPEGFVNCSDVFNQSNLLGGDPTCVSIANTLTILLGREPELIPYDVLTFLPGNGLYNRDVPPELRLEATGMVTVEEAISPFTPYFELFGSREVCGGNVNITVTEVTADACHEMDYFRTILPTDTSGLTLLLRRKNISEKYLHLVTVKFGFVLWMPKNVTFCCDVHVFRHQLKEDIDYVVIITATNRFGGESYLPSIHRFRRTNKPLALTIQGPTVVDAQRDVTFTVIVDICEEMDMTTSSLQFSWSIFPSLIDLSGFNGIMATVPKGYLQLANIYNVSVTVTTSSDENQWIDASLTIGVKRTSLQAVISSSNLVVGDQTPFTLDGSLSFDPSNAAGDLQLLWSCSDLVTTNTSCLGPSLLVNVQVLTIPAGSLLPSTYFIKLQVSKDTRNAMSQSTVTIRHGELPVVYIRKQKAGLVNPDDRLLVEGYVTSRANVTIRWEVVVEKEYAIANLEGVTSSVIPRHYHSSLVEPLTGLPITTPFTLDATEGWLDSPEDYPLTCTFSYRLIENDVHTPIITLSGAPSVVENVIFPGVLGQTTEVIVQVKVCDIWESCRIAEKKVSIHTLPSFSADDFDLINKTVVQYVNKGDYTRALSVARATAVTLNNAQFEELGNRSQTLFQDVVDKMTEGYLTGLEVSASSVLTNDALNFLAIAQMTIQPRSLRDITQQNLADLTLLLVQSLSGSAPIITGPMRRLLMREERGLRKERQTGSYLLPISPDKVKVMLGMDTMITSADPSSSTVESLFDSINTYLSGMCQHLVVGEDPAIIWTNLAALRSEKLEFDMLADGNLTLASLENGHNNHWMVLGSDLTNTYQMWTCGSKVCYGACVGSAEVALETATVIGGIDLLGPLLQIQLFNPRTGEQMFVEDLSSSITVTVRVEKINFSSGRVVACGMFNLATRSWNTDTCVTNNVDLNTGTLTCKCTALGYVGAILGDIRTTSIPSTEAESTATEVPTMSFESTTTIVPFKLILPILIKLNHSYNTLVEGRETAFIDNISKQLATLLGTSTRRIQDTVVWPGEGGIKYSFSLWSEENPSETAQQELQDTVDSLIKQHKEGAVTLYDEDGNVLDVDYIMYNYINTSPAATTTTTMPQEFERLVEISTTSFPREETTELLTTIQPPEPPQPITAQFSDSLDRILIKLSDSVRPEGLVNCSGLFNQSSLDLLGENPTCISIANTLTIQLGREPELIPYDVLTFLPGNGLYNRDVPPELGLEVIGMVTVEEAISPANPYFELSGPREVCRGAINVTVVEVTADAGFEMDYFQSIYPTDVSVSTIYNGLHQLQTLISGKSNIGISKPLSFSSSLLKEDIDYVLVVSAENRFGIRNFLPSVHLLRRTTKPLALTVQGPRVVETQRDVTFTAIVDVCGDFDLTTSGLQFIWSISPQIVDLSGFSGNTVIVPKGYLRFGSTYNLTVNVSVSSDKSQWNALSHSLGVKKSNLQAVVSSSYLVVGDQTSFKLDGALSFDPSNGAGDLQLLWSCTDQMTTDTSCFEASMLVNEQILTVPAGLLPPKTYVITLRASKDTRNAESQTAVSVRRGELPVIFVKKLKPDRINPSERLIVESYVTSRPNVTLRWEVVREREYALAPFGGVTTSVLSRNYNSKLVDRPFPLLIPAENDRWTGLLGGALYKFRLIANPMDGGEPGYADVVIETNNPPIKGMLKVAPPSGTALKTEFIMDATEGWRDSPEDYSLTYTFSYRLSTNDTDTPIATITQAPPRIENIVFPGASSHDTSIIVQVKVCDIINSCSIAERSVSIQRLSSFSDGEFDLLNKTVIRYLHQGDPVRAMSVARAITLTLDNDQYEGLFERSQTLFQNVVDKMTEDYLTGLNYHHTSSSRTDEVLSFLAVIPMTMRPSSLREVTQQNLENLTYSLLQELRRFNISSSETTRTFWSYDEVNQQTKSQIMSCVLPISPETVKVMLGMDTMIALADPSPSIVENLFDSINTYLSGMCQHLVVGEDPAIIWTNLAALRSEKLEFDMLADGNLTLASLENGQNNHWLVLGSELISVYQSWICDTVTCYGACIGSAEVALSTAVAIGGSSLVGPLLKIDLYNPVIGQRILIDELSTPVTFTIRVEHLQTDSRETILCGMFNLTTRSWNTDTCVTNNLDVNTGTLTCKCTALGYIGAVLHDIVTTDEPTTIFTTEDLLFDVETQGTTTETTTTKIFTTDEETESTTTKVPSTVTHLVTERKLPSTESPTTVVRVSTTILTPAPSRTSSTSPPPIDMFLKLAEDFYAIVGDQQDAFTTHLLNQLSNTMGLPLPCFSYFNISPGSIDVKFGLVPYTNDTMTIDGNTLQASASELTQMINGGGLKLTDLKGNQLTVVQLAPTATTTVAPPSISFNFTPIILGIVVGVFVLMLILVIMIAVIVKHLSRATCRVTPEEYVDKPPSYRGVHHEEALFTTAGSYGYSNRRLSVPSAPSYRPPTKSEINKTPRPPSSLRERLKEKHLKIDEEEFGERVDRNKPVPVKP
ncbi:uncharacterized protein LOC143236161 [Tachypleus tridentatus]|uniref:uncharacterized protein LOC143236161 n=1 Tax=Tachypleus tridentatus TaxID=6853 RepID=UPI003FD165E9